MRALFAIVALLMGVVAGQTASMMDVPVEHLTLTSMESASHATNAATTHAVGTQAAMMDCAGCADEDENREPCVGPSTSCGVGLVGLLQPEKSAVRIDGLAHANVLAAERAASGLALGVDTPPPRTLA